jgi:hypothetical protein
MVDDLSINRNFQFLCFVGLFAVQSSLEDLFEPVAGCFVG